MFRHPCFDGCRWRLVRQCDERQALAANCQWHTTRYIPFNLGVTKHYRGKASITPPSTGRVAPVVGVRLLAKKTTAFPTCRP